MAATRGTPINTDDVMVRAQQVDIIERDVDGARCELVIERSGERWTIQVHFDGAIEPVDAPHASPPPWIARAIQRYEFATSE